MMRREIRFVHSPYTFEGMVPIVVEVKLHLESPPFRHPHMVPQSQLPPAPERRLSLSRFAHLLPNLPQPTKPSIPSATTTSMGSYENGFASVRGSPNVSEPSSPYPFSMAALAAHGGLPMSSSSSSSSHTHHPARPFVPPQFDSIPSSCSSLSVPQAYAPQYPFVTPVVPSFSQPSISTAFVGVPLSAQRSASSSGIINCPEAQPGYCTPKVPPKVPTSAVAPPALDIPTSSPPSIVVVLPTPLPTPGTASSTTGSPESLSGTALLRVPAPLNDRFALPERLHSVGSDACSESPRGGLSLLDAPKQTSFTLSSNGASEDPAEMDLSDEAGLQNGLVESDDVDADESPTAGECKNSRMAQNDKPYVKFIGTPCAHAASWKRLRAKRGWAHFLCGSCGAKWKKGTVSQNSSNDDISEIPAGEN